MIKPSSDVEKCGGENKSLFTNVALLLGEHKFALHGDTTHQVTQMLRSFSRMFDNGTLFQRRRTFTCTLVHSALNFFNRTEISTKHFRYQPANVQVNSSNMRREEVHARARNSQVTGEDTNRTISWNELVHTSSSASTAPFSREEEFVFVVFYYVLNLLGHLVGQILCFNCNVYSQHSFLKNNRRLL